VRWEEFEHLIAAAAQICGENEIVVIGSQAILGADREPPEALLRSMEADLYPRHAPEKAIEIEGPLGDGSQFHRTNGYYAHGVGPGTAKAPRGWEERLVEVKILPRVASKREAVALCLEAHDLVLAKCVRGSERDWEFAEDAIAAGLVGPSLLERVDALPIPADDRKAIRRMLEARLPG
jgi:hypothetical protein